MVCRHCQLFGWQLDTSRIFLPTKEKTLSGYQILGMILTYLYKYCAGDLIRRCVPEIEMSNILYHCHDSGAGGHYAANKTVSKVLEARFFGLSFSRMGEFMLQSLIDVNKQVTSPKEIKFPYSLFSHVKYLMWE